MLLLIRLMAVSVVLLCSSKGSRGEQVVLSSLAWSGKRRGTGGPASCLNSRRERVLVLLVRLDDLRMEGDPGACLAVEEAGRREEHGAERIEGARLCCWRRRGAQDTQG